MSGFISYQCSINDEKKALGRVLTQLSCLKPRILDGPAALRQRNFSPMFLFVCINTHFLCSEAIRSQLQLLKLANFDREVSYQADYSHQPIRPPRVSKRTRFR
jgi:hypothetical protein